MGVMAKESPERVLIVEDDASMAMAMQSALSRRRYATALAGTCGGGLCMARKTRPTLVVLDIYLPDGTGWELLRSLRRTQEPPPAVVAVSAGEVRRSDLRAYGVDAFLSKPFDMSRLVEAVERLTAPAGKGHGP